MGSSAEAAMSPGPARDSEPASGVGPEAGSAVSQRYSAAEWTGDGKIDAETTIGTLMKDAEGGL